MIYSRCWVQSLHWRAGPCCLSVLYHSLHPLISNSQAVDILFLRPSGQQVTCFFTIAHHNRNILLENSSTFQWYRIKYYNTAEYPQKLNSKYTSPPDRPEGERQCPPPPCLAEQAQCLCSFGTTNPKTFSFRELYKTFSFKNMPRFLVRIDFRLLSTNREI